MLPPQNRQADRQTLYRRSLLAAGLPLSMKLRLFYSTPRCLYLRWLVAKPLTNLDRPATECSRDGFWTYERLFQNALSYHSALCDSGVKPGDRVAISLPPSCSFTAALLGTLLCRAVAVPLCNAHPPHEQEYAISTAKASALIARRETAESLSLPAAVRVLHNVPEASAQSSRKDLIESVQRLSSSSVAAEPSALSKEPVEPVCLAAPTAESLRLAAAEAVASKAIGSLVIYTSGTTGRPKAAVHSHFSLSSTVSSLAAAWDFSPSDKLLHVLPVHHVHGLVNGILLPLSIGASIQFSDWHPATSLDVSKAANPPSVFFGTPSHYAQWNATLGTPGSNSSVATGVAPFRLLVSGSAALPGALRGALARHIGVNRILERYGSTEAGMVLSQTLGGPYTTGCVGLPLPGVEVTMCAATAGVPAAAEAGDTAQDVAAPQPLFVRSRAMFMGYFDNDAATAACCTPNGWFDTGDVVYYGEEGGYRIAGRASADVLKSGGYKISALDIESAIGENEKVAAAVVLALPDDVLGDKIVALVEWKDKTQETTPVWDFECHRDLASRLAKYCLPRIVVTTHCIPRNAMGKVNKHVLRTEIDWESGMDCRQYVKRLS